MNIYVGGRIVKSNYIREVYKKLESRGHGITTKWTDQIDIFPLHEHLEEARKYIKEDLDGIEEADVVLFFMEYEPNARGTHTEFGYALKLHRDIGSPRIIIIFDGKKPSMFYMYEGVEMVTSFEEALKLLEK